MPDTTPVPVDEFIAKAERWVTIDDMRLLRIQGVWVQDGAETYDEDPAFKADFGDDGTRDLQSIRDAVGSWPKDPAFNLLVEMTPE